MILLQDGLEDLLLEINDNKLALEGLKTLFQEDLAVVKYLLSVHSNPEWVV